MTAPGSAIAITPDGASRSSVAHRVAMVDGAGGVCFGRAERRRLVRVDDRGGTVLLVLIAGASAQFSELPGQVLLTMGDLVVRDDGTQLCSSYVDGAAIAPIEALGLDVEVVLSDQEQADRLASYPGGDAPVVG